MQNRKLIKDTGAVTLTTANQVLGPYTVPNFGDLNAIDVELIGTPGGSGATAQSGTNLLALHSVSFKDVASQAIIDAPEGTDLPREAFMLSMKLDYQRGIYPTSTQLPVISTTTASTVGFLTPTRWNSADLAGSVQFTFGTLSDVFSTVGSGTYTLQLKLWGIYEDVPNVNTNGLPVLPSMRVFAVPKIASTASGDNVVDMSQYVGQLHSNTAIYLTADADLTSINFAPAGGAGYDVIPAQNIIDEERQHAFSGHQTALFLLNHTPYYVSTRTKLVSNAASGKALRLYILKEGI